jgi:hypothetical protein
VSNGHHFSILLQGFLVGCSCIIIETDKEHLLQSSVPAQFVQGFTDRNPGGTLLWETVNTRTYSREGYAQDIILPGKLIAAPVTVSKQVLFPCWTNKKGTDLFTQIFPVKGFHNLMQ